MQALVSLTLWSHLRESMRRGVFVDALTEKSISNGKEAYEVCG